MPDHVKKEEDAFVHKTPFGGGGGGGGGGGERERERD